MTKKRKPLDSAMQDFVFGKEAAPAPTPPAVEAASGTPTPPSAQAPAPTAPPAAPAPTPIFEAASGKPAPPSAQVVAVPPTPHEAVPAAETPAPTPVQPKENSLMSKLQAPDKEATVRFTVDMPESMHRKLSVLAAKTGRKKVDIVRVLLEEGLKEVEG